MKNCYRNNNNILNGINVNDKYYMDIKNCTSDKIKNTEGDYEILF